jgi:hypothetical protein
MRRKSDFEDCLFPIASAVDESLRVTNLNNKLLPAIDRLWKKNEERSAIIISASYLEEVIESLLHAWIGEGEYSKLKKSFAYNEITFAQKIGLLKSFKLIPSFYLDDATHIKKIRDQFAHELEFDELKDFEKIPKLKPLLDELKKRADEIDPEPSIVAIAKGSYIDMFKILVTATIMGISGEV